MAIAPITEPGMLGITGMPQAKNRSGSAKEAGGGDFLQAFSNAQDQMNQSLPAAKTEGAGAQGKDSGNNTASEQKQVKDTKDSVRKEEPQKAAPAEQTQKTEKTGRAEPAAEAETEPQEEEVDVSAAAQQLFLEIAQMLGVSPEELAGTLEEMGLDASALLEPANINRLVIEVQGGGDPFAMVTDGELVDLAKELNNLAGETVGQLQEGNVSRDPEELQDVLADALRKMTEEAPQTEEVTATVQTQTSTDEENDNGQGEITEKRRSRTEYFEERAAQDAMAQLNTDVMDTEAADLTEAVREQTQELRYASNPQEIMDQVLDQIKTQVKQDMTSLDMVLHPASLGHVALNLTSRDGAVTAQLTAQNENVRAALESQIQILKENLEQAGVKVEAVEVTVSSHAFEQNLEQGNDRESDAQMQERERLRKATHKINLGGSDGEGVEGIDDLGEAEAVNVAMMQADGRRLDYRT